jgi:RNA polymerase sigma factor (TIGR02999 family)
MADPRTVTLLLAGWAAGDKDAFNRLVPLVYDELRRTAAAYMAREGGSRLTLQPTALINEAYMRLVGVTHPPLDRGHFFALAAAVMRHVLTDYGKNRNRQKRGGGTPTLSLEDSSVGELPRELPEPEEVLALDEIFDRFKAIDPHRARVFEIHFYGGFTGQEIADALGISVHKAAKDLTSAKAWLRRELNKRKSP